MTQNHKGNTQPAIDQEEHTSVGGIDAKKVMLFDNAGNQITSFGGSPNTGNVTINPGPSQIGSVTISHPVSTTFAGNVTLDAGSLTGIKGNLTLSDSKGFIGLTTTVIGSTATLFAVVNTSAGGGNVTLDGGSQTGIKGNVTLTDSKGFIGLVTVGNTVATTFTGNVTLDAGSKTQIVGNVTLTDSKGFIGLVTSVPSNVARTITGNVTLDAGSLTGIVGNVTLSDSKGFIGLVTSVPSNVARTITGNLSIAYMPQPAAPTAVVAFLTSNATAGLRTQLSSNVVNAGILQAPSTNTGLIYIGAATVSATVYGAELQAGQSTGIAISNTDKIYVDSSVNGDKVAFLGS